MSHNVESIAMSIVAFVMRVDTDVRYFFRNDHILRADTVIILVAVISIHILVFEKEIFYTFFKYL